MPGKASAAVQEALLDCYNERSRCRSCKNRVDLVSSHYGPTKLANQLGCQSGAAEPNGPSGSQQSEWGRR